MVREQERDAELFITCDEIARASRNSFYILLAQLLDWRRLSEPFVAAYSLRYGRPTDPAVYLKIFVISYFENIAYDTDLAERISDSLAIREFLGYSLRERTPDHSTISENRARIARRCSIEQVLTAVVQACIEAGLVGDTAAFDTSLVPANASLSSLRHADTGESVREHLRKVDESNKQSSEPVAAADTQSQPELDSPAKKTPKEKPKVSNKDFRSMTDPDARIAQKPGSPRDMYYKVGHVTDSRCGVILAADCVRADQSEEAGVLPALRRATEILSDNGLKLANGLGDTGFESSDFCHALENLGIVSYINYEDDRSQKPEGFRKKDFRYVKESNHYICPWGRILKCIGLWEGDYRYRSNPADCRVCPHRVECLSKDATQRSVKRHPQEECRERNIARCHTDEGRAFLRKRKTIVEMGFGHMKTYGGMRLINCRGLAKARMKAIMAAVAMNLIKLVKAAIRKAGPTQPTGCISGASAPLSRLRAAFGRTSCPIGAFRQHKMLPNLWIKSHGSLAA